MSFLVAGEFQGYYMVLFIPNTILDDLGFCVAFIVVFGILWALLYANLIVPE